MSAGNVFGLSFCFLAWTLWLYQVITGNLLNRNWQLWTTRKEKPIQYWIFIVAIGLVILFGSVMFTRDALR
jgi:hypothetical protein